MAVDMPSRPTGDFAAPGDTARSWAGLPPLLVAAFCAIGLLLTAAFLATVINLRSVYNTADAVAHTQGVISALERLLGTAVDAETGERGFIITAREAYLEPYDRARADLAETLARVQALTADNAAQQADVERLRSLTGRKLAELAEAIGQRRASGFPAAQAVVLTNAGKQTMDALRGVVSQMKNREEALFATRVAQSSQQIALSALGIARIRARRTARSGRVGGIGTLWGASGVIWTKSPSRHTLPPCRLCLRSSPLSTSYAQACLFPQRTRAATPL